MRIYAINSKTDGKARLVKANTPAQAMRHVAHDLFDVKVATATQVAELIIGGVTLEHAANQSEDE